MSRKRILRKSFTLTLVLTILTSPILSLLYSQDAFFTKPVLADSETYYEENGLVIDSDSVALFDSIPENYLQEARETHMFWMNRSVGGNISDGLTCLGSADEYGTPGLHPAHCRRDYVDGSQTGWKSFTATDYSNGAVPDVISYDPDRIKYNRSNWRYEYWGDDQSSGSTDTWSNKVDYFVNRADRLISQDPEISVASFQFSYLEVDGNSNVPIESPTEGYFSRNPARSGIEKIEQFEIDNPDVTFIHWTTSLALVIGTEESETFNNQVRQYAINNNKVLFDAADILSTDRNGNECYGITPESSQYRAICRDYTTEATGGHLGSVSGGKIQVAKAYWVLMSCLSGWDGCSDGNSEPTNQPPFVNAGVDSSVTLPVNNLALVGSVNDDGLPTNNVSLTWSQVNGPAVASIDNPLSTSTNISLPVPGTYTFRLTSSDGELSSFDDVVVTLNDYYQNVAPVANNLSVQVNNNSNITINFPYQDSDGPGPYSLVINSGPSYGTLSGSGLSRVYTPEAGFTGVDTIRWSIYDGQATSNIATISIEVREVTQPPTTGIDAYWSFNTALPLEEVSGCNCSTYNTFWGENSGIHGGALDYNGANSYTDLGDFRYIAGKPQMSISMWIQPDFDNTSGVRRYVLANGSTLNLYYLETTHNWRAVLRTSTGLVRIDAKDIDWTAGSWNMITLTYDGSQAKLYWNGVQNNSANITGVITTMGSSGNYLGSSPLRNMFFDGKIDELSVYSEALTDQEVLGLYLAH